MAGYKLEKVATTRAGNLDLDDLRGEGERAHRRAHAHEPLDARPLRRDIEEVAEIFHAQRRAPLRRRREPERVRRHLAARRHGLRRRALQPAQDVLDAARRRRPGRRPGRAYATTSRRSCPAPLVVREGDVLPPRLRPPASRSGGSRLPRATSASSSASYAYMRAYGAELTRDVRERRAQRQLPARAAARTPTSCRTTGLHARVRALGAQPASGSTGVTALDIAKRLIDYGFHPPTIYFPLIVHEALMIEPTETETKEALDAFVDAMLAIADEAAESRHAPEGAPDAAGAAPRRGRGREAARRQVRLRRASARRGRGLSRLRGSRASGGELPGTICGCREPWREHRDEREREAAEQEHAVEPAVVEDRAERRRAHAAAEEQREREE